MKEKKSSCAWGFITCRNRSLTNLSYQFKFWVRSLTMMSFLKKKANFEAILNNLLKKT